MRYEVIKAWQGVSVGDVIETDSLHDALKSNVRQVVEEKVKEVEQEAPRRGRPPKDKE